MTGLPTSFTVLLDDGTGAFPYDISSYVMASGWNFSRGRQDWQGGVTAGSLSLTLNNSTGRFTPGSTLIASPSPIKVDQRLRVKETVNGVTLTRFTGYVKSWPVAWPATVGTIAMSSIRVVDAQARAERRVLQSVPEEEIKLDSPIAYYTLGEPAGSTTAGDTSGNQAPSLTTAGSGAAVTFGTATGPGTDGLTAAQFSGGQYLRAGSTSSPSVLECDFLRSGNPSTAEILLGIEGGAAVIGIGTDGKIHTGPSDLGSGPVVTDGATHALSWQSGHVLVDGVDIGAPTFAPTAGLITVGGASSSPTGAPSAALTGVVAHVAAFSALSTTRATSHAQAALTGFAGESDTARLTRLCGYAGIPVGTLDTSLTNVAFEDITGKTAWEAIQQVVDAAVGVAFIDETGALEFHNRNRNSAKTTPDLSVVATNYVAPDISPVDDDQQILNYVETTAVGTGVSRVARNALSESGNGTATNPGHGRYSDSRTYLVSTDAEALDRANWIVANFAEPTTRYGTLTVNLYAMPASVAQAFLSALDIDTWLRVTQMASQNTGGTTINVVVEGYTEQATGSSWSVTLNVVSRALFQAWILDDTTNSVLDSTTRLFV